MTTDLAAEPKFVSEFSSTWSSIVRGAAPLFVKLLPAYLAITLATSFLAVGVLLILGKAAFHLVCMFSPLVFLLIGMALDTQAGQKWVAAKPSAWLPVATRFWRYAAPLAMVVALCMNLMFLFAMLLGDLGAWRSGALPNLNFPTDLFTAKLPLLLLLLTTATEQQLVFMPFLVVLGGRFEPHLVALVIAGRCSLDKAREAQAGLSKRDRFLYGPLRLLVILGVSLQFLAKDVSQDHAYMGKVLLLGSYFGWLMYACMLSVVASRNLPRVDTNPQA